LSIYVDLEAAVTRYLGIGSVLQTRPKYRPLVEPDLYEADEQVLCEYQAAR